MRQRFNAGNKTRESTRQGVLIVANHLSLPWSLADNEDGVKQAASKNAQEFDHCQESTRSISKEARLGIDGTTVFLKPFRRFSVKMKFCIFRPIPSWRYFHYQKSFRTKSGKQSMQSQQHMINSICPLFTRLQKSNRLRFQYL